MLPPCFSGWTAALQSSVQAFGQLVRQILDAVPQGASSALHAATSWATPASPVMKDLVAATLSSGPAFSEQGDVDQVGQGRGLIVDHGDDQVGAGGLM